MVTRRGKIGGLGGKMGSRVSGNSPEGVVGGKGVNNSPPVG